MARLVAILLTLLLAGCGARERRDAPWLEPPPARGEPIGRDEAIAIIQSAGDGETAIRELDGRRFAFALDAPTLAWFREQEVPGEVMDYLAKRARVDWDSLRGDVDPDSPEPPEEYPDPRRGFEDFAGYDRRESWVGSTRSRNPFAGARRPTRLEALLYGE